MKIADCPSLRLAVPLIGGILISDIVGNTGNQTHVLICVLVPVLSAAFLSFSCGDRFPRLYGIFLSLSFFLAGALLYDLHMQGVVTRWPAGRTEYHGILTDWPYERAASYRLDLTLTGPEYEGKRIYLYVPKDSSVFAVTPGARVSFQGVIDMPQSDSVSGFDYRKYLYRQGVSGTLWVNSRYWGREPAEMTGGVRIKAVRIRHAMFEHYREWGLEGKPLALVAAVSLGYKRELDESMRDLYSASGASHLLAVSGLHVGIMYSFLYFLFPLFLNRRSLQWLRELVVICVMWGFAFLMGMPVSIIRSVVMFSMIAFCRATGRDSSSVNTLAFAALVMLVADPASLFDIGFRLSFCAVLSILLFGPLIAGILNARTRLGNWLINLMSVSIAAQIGTAPMVIYSFTGFPTYFMLTNLLSIPLMFMMVSLSMTLWAFSWIVPLRSLIVKVLVFLSNLLEGILSRIVSLPFSRIEVSIDDAWKVWALYGIIIFVYCWLAERKTRHLVRALSIVALWSVVSFFISIG